MTPAELLVIIDAIPAAKDPAHPEIQPDGYVPGPMIVNLLTGSYGTVPNPVPQGTIPKPFTAQQILGSVSAANRAKSMQSAAIVGIQNSIGQQDRAAIANWAQLCVDATIITTDEQTAIMALLAATIPDPVPAPPLVTGIDPVELLSLVNQARALSVANQGG